MASKLFCDFCGEEMAGPVAARLVITRSAVADLDEAIRVHPLAQLMGLTDAVPNQVLDMCDPCLTHLLPIRARLQAHAAAQRAPRPACAAVAELRHVATIRQR